MFPRYFTCYKCGGTLHRHQVAFDTFERGLRVLPRCAEQPACAAPVGGRGPGQRPQTPSGRSETRA